MKVFSYVKQNFKGGLLRKSSIYSCTPFRQVVSSYVIYTKISIEDDKDAIQKWFLLQGEGKQFINVVGSA